MPQRLARHQIAASTASAISEPGFGRSKKKTKIKIYGILATTSRSLFGV